MNNIFHINPRAVAAGLMLHPTGEPQFTDAGLFSMVGAFAYRTDIDEEARLHNLGALVRVLNVARDGGLDERAETYLFVLLAEGVDPLDSSDKGRLLATLCRLVSLFVGPGRMVSLIQNRKAH